MVIEKESQSAFQDLRKALIKSDLDWPYLFQILMQFMSRLLGNPEIGIGIWNLGSHVESYKLI